MTPPQIPKQNGINSAAFAETLSHTDASYKFLWLLSLLEILRRRGYDCARPVLFADIFFNILKLAKDPVNRFKLYFGKGDRLESYIAALDNSAGLIWNWDSENPATDNRAFQNACEQLSGYVPYRWIRPFVAAETKGAGGPTKNEKQINLAIIKAAREKFDGDLPPPYRIAASMKSIEIHPQWADYFCRNAEIIKGWCLWHFARFLQTRNPNIPAIINKIGGEDGDRQPLGNQREFWEAVMKQTGINCIYSGKPLARGNYALDHYVPWSFVGHNNLWNLIPALPSANSSKGDSLPDGRYLGALAETHHRALETRARHFPKKGEKMVESYAADLKLPFADLTDAGKLRRAYESFIPPLIDLAKANRFRAGWVYKSPTPLMDGGS